MRVYAPAPFRFGGTDYPFGFQEVTDALGDTLKGAGLVTNGPTPQARRARPLSRQIVR